jgi:hypothetical protein
MKHINMFILLVGLIVLTPFGGHRLRISLHRLNVNRPEVSRVIISRKPLGVISRVKHALTLPRT